MLPAAVSVRRAIEAEMASQELIAKEEDSSDKSAEDEVKNGDSEKDEAEAEITEEPISLAQHAWPLINMLERSALGDEKANIVWSARSDF